MLGFPSDGDDENRRSVRMNRVDRRRALSLLCGCLAGLFVAGCTKRREFVLRNELKPRTFEQLLTLTPTQLERVDIGRMNLICAQEAQRGTWDVDEFCSRMDQWALRIGQEAERYWTSFTRAPERYDGSSAKFRAVNLALSLKEVFHCRYETELIASGAMSDIHSPAFFRNPDPVFVSGLLSKRRGTCSSYPVLIAAIGRRLGYPIGLKATWGHLFCVWDDGVESFNLDTNGTAVDTPPDEHYGRQSIPPKFRGQAMAERWMVPFTAVDSLGTFIETAGFCHEANGRMGAALRCYRLALQYRPGSINLRRLASRFDIVPKGGA